MYPHTMWVTWWRLLQSAVVPGARAVFVFELLLLYSTVAPTCKLCDAGIRALDWEGES